MRQRVVEWWSVVRLHVAPRRVGARHGTHTLVFSVVCFFFLGGGSVDRRSRDQSRRLAAWQASGWRRVVELPVSPLLRVVVRRVALLRRGLLPSFWFVGSLVDGAILGHRRGVGFGTAAAQAILVGRQRFSL